MAQDNGRGGHHGGAPDASLGEWDYLLALIVLLLFAVGLVSVDPVLGTGYMAALGVGSVLAMILAWRVATLVGPRCLLLHRGACLLIATGLFAGAVSRRAAWQDWLLLGLFFMVGTWSLWRRWANGALS
jgi:high-affinity Fe2+/Pb2+ permease